MSTRLIAEGLIDDLTEDEKARQRIVEDLLPSISAYAARGRRAQGEFPEAHLKAFRESGLLGLVVPDEYGGMGGTLRDLAATTYALGTACGSTALAYFFHCSSSSRGLLPLGAIDAGLYAEDEVPVVRAFAEKVLTLMGTEGKWIGNFASEAVKAEQRQRRHPDRGDQDRGRLAAQRREVVRLPHRHRRLLPGHRAARATSRASTRCACSSSTAASRGRARRAPTGTAWACAPRATTASSSRTASSPTTTSLTVPGALHDAPRRSRAARGSATRSRSARSTPASRAARTTTRSRRVMTQKFADTGAPIASSPDAPGDDRRGREAARRRSTCGLRRQLLLETAEPEILPKADVVRNWRLTKGAVCERRIRGHPDRAQDVRHLRRADGQPARPRASATRRWVSCRRSRPSAASSTSRRWSSTATAPQAFNSDLPAKES